jgi:WhiB family redox-sensing transcriptional regulator
LCTILTKQQLVDPELWWPNGATGIEAEKAEEARSICNRCPVKAECLTYAIERKQYWGVWGGTTEEERREDRRAARRILARQVDRQEPVRVAS